MPTDESLPPETDTETSPRRIRGFQFLAYFTLIILAICGGLLLLAGLSQSSLVLLYLPWLGLVGLVLLMPGRLTVPLLLIGAFFLIVLFAEAGALNQVLGGKLGDILGLGAALGFVSGFMARGIRTGDPFGLAIKP